MSIRSVPSNQQNGQAAPQPSRDGQSQRSAHKQKEHLKDDEKLPPTRVSILDRIDHVTWANFTFPMATGGIALLLSEQSHNFDGILTIGKIVYIFDLVIFVTLVSLITTRFIRQPRKLWISLTDPSEALFHPTFWLCIPTIVGGMVQYGEPVTGLWLVTVTEVIFWVYAAATFVLAVLQYWSLFLRRQLTVDSMTPSWLLPIFPVMLSGTVASLIAPTLSPTRRSSVLVAGLTFQGLGFWTSLLMYATWIVRLMQDGLPDKNLRPGMFIAVGPPAFTGLALIGMARSLPVEHGYFVEHPAAVDYLQVVALVFAIFIWCLAFWFFCISAISCLAAFPHMDFHLVWYAFVSAADNKPYIAINSNLNHRYFRMSALPLQSWILGKSCTVRALRGSEVV